LLRTRSLDPAVTTRALDSIERNARLEAELIDNLLDVARLITGRVHLHVDRVDPRDVVSAAIATITVAATAKHITVSTDIAVDAGWIAGDRERLVQVVWHLLANAIKVTPRGGRVDVHVARAGEHRVRLDVRDTGRGIAADFLPFVFDRFRQAEPPFRRVGLGLGLAIVRHLVELHGGTVSVASAGEGRGATFTVELPRAADAGDADAGAAGADGGGLEMVQRSSG
jgi:signal transduction histidine kinase